MANLNDSFERILDGDKGSCIGANTAVEVFARETLLLIHRGVARATKEMECHLIEFALVVALDLLWRKELVAPNTGLTTGNFTADGGTEFAVHSS